MLRDGALSDRRVIDLLNTELVPVWINVRTQALPRLPVWPHVLTGARLDAQNRVIDPLSKGFFVRNVVVTPDCLSLLNPQAETVSGSMHTYVTDGYYAYAQTEAGDLLV